MKKILLITGAILLSAYMSYGAVVFQYKETLTSSKLNTAFDEKVDKPTFNSYTSGVNAALATMFTSPTFTGTVTMPSGGATVPQGSTAQLIEMYEASAGGTNKITLTVPAAIAADHTYTLGETGILLDGAEIGGGGTWGSITGTLADQTDLQDALDAITAGGINITTAVPSTSGSANLNDSTHVLSIASTTGVTTFTGSFTAWDTTPAAFSFTDITDATVSTEYTSDAVQITGINYPVAVTTSSGTAAICTGTDIGTCGAFTASPGNISVNQYVRARVTSSGSNSTAVTAPVTIGGVSDTYSVTTVSGESYLINEDFTAGAAPPGWTAASSSVLYNYATTPAPLGGSGYSFAIDSTQSASSITVTTETFTPVEDIYVSTWYVFTTATPGDSRDILSIRTSTATICAISHDISNTLDGINTGGTQVSNFAPVVMGTPIYLQIHYQKGTGSNAVCTFESSTDGTNWTAEGSSTNGTSTADADRLQFSASGSSNNQQIYDAVRVSMSHIDY